MDLDRCPIETDAENRSILKIVVLSILISILWKFQSFRNIDYWIQELPLQDSHFFPWFFREQTVARLAYLAASGTAVAMLFSKSQRFLTFLSAALLTFLLILNLHQSGYNDVTFICCAWAAAWCWWMSTRLSETTATLQPRAAWLAHAILSLIFMGAAVGKMTPEYWSGEVLYEIYFRDRDFWFYNLIRDSYSVSQVRDIATWHSRMVSLSELVCAFLWLMPTRIASWIAIVMLLGIALTNNTFLFSVVTSLAGLAIVGLHQSRQPRHVDINDSANEVSASRGESV